MQLLSIISFALGASCLVIPDAGTIDERDLAERGRSATTSYEPAAALDLLAKRGERYSDCRVAFHNYAVHPVFRVDVSRAIIGHEGHAVFDVGGALIVTIYGRLAPGRIAIGIQNGGVDESTLFFGELNSARDTNARALTKLTVGGNQDSALYDCVPITSYRGSFFLSLRV